MYKEKLCISYIYRNITRLDKIKKTIISYGLREVLSLCAR